MNAQQAPNWGSFQVPEPWSGDLTTAPVLFLGSNPSFEPEEQYPTASWEEEEVWQFFSERFTSRWSRDLKVLKVDGGYKAVAYWKQIKERCEELIERPAAPGQDFALSEVTHCKSKSQLGVSLACKTCADKYLMKLLGCSGSIVFVLVGIKAFDVWNQFARDYSVLPVTPKYGATPLIPIAGRTRLAVHIGHPSGLNRGPKSFRECIHSDDLLRIRSHLKEQLSVL